MINKKDIEQLLIIAGIDPSEVENKIDTSQDSKRGDFAYPCFRLAKEKKQSPQVIAQMYAERIFDDKLEKVENVGGYINFFVDRKKFALDAIKVMQKNSFSGTKHGLGKTITIDYSSVNIAKPMHIGHLSSTAIGGSLRRIYKYLGYEVVGINHLGDYGTQFGKLIVAYKKWGGEKELNERGIMALLDWYVRYHKEVEKEPSMDDEARAWFVKIEKNDKEALDIFEKFKKITLDEDNKVYKRLGVEFESWNGESFYNDKMQPIVDILVEQNILKESNGAKVVDVGDDIPPCLILRSDGASLYATRDLAAAKYRKDTYNFEKNLYVVAYQQNLHFKQVFAVLEKMGFEWAKDCIHVNFGMVSLPEGKSLKTREGGIVFLNDVLDQAVNKALDTINAKNPNHENKEQIAEAVGVGAVVFGVLSAGRIKDICFDIDKALNFDGETGPYLQYTNARCKSIIEKYGKSKAHELNIDALIVDEVFDLIKQLSSFDDVVFEAAQKNEPSVVTRYLLDLAQLFNKFYLSNRILGEKEDIAYTRYCIVVLVSKALEKGLNLILLQAPQKM